MLNNIALVEDPVRPWIQLGFDYRWGVKRETDRRVDGAVRASNCLDFGQSKIRL
jgi:hypothetical protein